METYAIGQHVRIYPDASEYSGYIGCRAIIKGELGDDERDLEEVGRMFVVEIESDNPVKVYLQVFTDEIEKV